MSEPDLPHVWPRRGPGGGAGGVPGGVTVSISDPGEGNYGDKEVVELALSLPARDVAALERAARQRGLTVGQAVRRLITGFLCQARR